MTTRTPFSAHSSRMADFDVTTAEYAHGEHSRAVCTTISPPVRGRSGLPPRHRTIPETNVAIQSASVNGLYVVPVLTEEFCDRVDGHLIFVDHRARAMTGQWNSHLMPHSYRERVGLGRGPYEMSRRRRKVCADGATTSRKNSAAPKPAEKPKACALDALEGRS
jgi:hypothetical protein